MKVPTDLSGPQKPCSENDIREFTALSVTTLCSLVQVFVNQRKPRKNSSCRSSEVHSVWKTLVVGHSLNCDTVLGRPEMLKFLPWDVLYISLALRCGTSLCSIKSIFV
jgi:hypothetical protein